jgi:hypothetical protein
MNLLKEDPSKKRKRMKKGSTFYWIQFSKKKANLGTGRL